VFEFDGVGASRHLLNIRVGGVAKTALRVLTEPENAEPALIQNCFEVFREIDASLRASLDRNAREIQVLLGNRVVPSGAGLQKFRHGRARVLAAE
jgi:hypothetical protein